MPMIGVRDLVARSYVIHGGASQRGGWSGSDVSVSHVVGPSQGSGLMGWVGSRWVLSGSRMIPYRSVYQSYTDTGQSSDPSGLVGSCRAISGFDGFPSEHCFVWHDGTRQDRSTVPYQCTIDVRTPWARHGGPRALRGPVGTQRTPRGPLGALSDPV